MLYSEVLISNKIPNNLFKHLSNPTMHHIGVYEYREKKHKPYIQWVYYLVSGLGLGTMTSYRQVHQYQNVISIVMVSRWCYEHTKEKHLAVFSVHRKISRSSFLIFLTQAWPHGYPLLNTPKSLTYIPYLKLDRIFLMFASMSRAKHFRDNPPY